MSMFDPCHPGELVWHECLEPLEIGIAEAAEHLQVEESELAAICECRAPISADMAVRFEMAFGSTADFWLQLQNAYDLAQARKTGCKISKIERAA